MKRWHQDSTDQLPTREKSKKSRKKIEKKVTDTNESDFELQVDQWASLVEQGCFAARVVEVHKGYAFVSSEALDEQITTQDVWLASIARKFTQTQRRERNFFAVGDKVLCRPGTKKINPSTDELPSCVIEHRAPRKNKISRLDPINAEREHVIACNISQMIVVSSYVYPKVKWGLIDRYLVLAAEQNIPVVIVLNKKDLLEKQKKEFQENCEELSNIYKNIGYSIVSLQANSTAPEEQEKIVNLFKDKISLVSGHSGVGKSSLVNKLRPEINQDVENEEILLKGRHTTTYASLIKLGIGGFVIDTPGIRSFLLQERSSIDLAWCFVEIRPFALKCKYRQCKHQQEPKCAVVQAVKDGQISEWRYKSYLAILTGASGREGRIRDVAVEP